MIRIIIPVKSRRNCMVHRRTQKNTITKLTSQKLKAAKESIIRQTSRGDFPIISYSYYEYAGTLKESDPPSALLFSEYALELSNLQVYLNHSAPSQQYPEIEGSKPETRHETSLAAAAATGIAAGILTFLAATLLARKMQTPSGKRIIILKRKRKT